MGNWTFDIQDDFTLPDGSERTVYQTSDLKNLHSEFAMECKLVLQKYWLIITFHKNALYFVTKVIIFSTVVN